MGLVLHGHASLSKQPDLALLTCSVSCGIWVLVDNETALTTKTRLIKSSFKTSSDKSHPMPEMAERICFFCPHVIHSIIVNWD